MCLIEETDDIAPIGTEGIGGWQHSLLTPPPKFWENSVSNGSENYEVAPAPMISLVSLTRHLISQIQKQLTNCGRIKALKPLDVQETMKRLISCLFVPWSITVLILTLRR